MIKRISLALAFLLIFACSSIKTAPARAEQDDSRIFMDLRSGRVLYEKNADEKRPIASLTKILTAIVVIENCDLEREITVPAECCGIEGSSIYLRAGEKLTVKELLYGLMLRSGNDCAETLAVKTFGSIENFARAMNQTAARIGAANSQFLNPHGLNVEGHYSTARDMAQITAYGMKNETFRRIVGTKSQTISGEEENRYLVNKNKLLFNYDGCIGVKTGYTKAAGRCLAAAAERNGNVIVSVVLGCAPMYEVTAEGYDKAFSAYNWEKIISKDEFDYSFELPNAKNKCECRIANDLIYPLKEGEQGKIRSEITEDKISLPVKKNEKIGVLKIYLENQLIFSENIYSILDVEKKFDFFRPFKKWTER